MLPDAILLEPTDFVAFPIGGQTAFCRQMMKAFGARLALVGFSTDETPVGQWTEKIFDGTSFHFFSVARMQPTGRKPLVPLRVKSFRAFRRFRREILSLGVRNVFTQAPETLLATHTWEWESICFLFPGIRNILERSRYLWAQPLAALYERRLARALAGVDVVLASADEAEITAFRERTKPLADSLRITSFPTRVDTDVFFPRDRQALRAELDLPAQAPLFVSVSRLSSRKGWQLVLEAFALLQARVPDALLVLAGDGEDREAVYTMVAERGLETSVRLPGLLTREEVALYNAACDTFVSGSYFEGWPIAHLEAIAAGAAIVSTDVSGTRQIVAEGKNGFLLHGRDPQEMADRMQQTLHLERATEVSVAMAQPYAVSRMAEELGALWAPLAERGAR